MLLYACLSFFVPVLSQREYEGWTLVYRLYLLLKDLRWMYVRANAAFQQYFRTDAEVSKLFKPAEVLVDAVTSFKAIHDRHVDV